jgi:predicted phage terminase large subunit-like protein
LDWRWEKYNSSISFSHFQHTKNKKTWQGSQIAFIGWDEVTHFDADIFWYMLSRNRSTCGVKPCVRATCNPEPGSWIADLLDWWIGEDGFPIPERDGVLRWFTRDGDIIQWADDPSEFGDNAWKAKSLTFIKGVLSDNPTLSEKDPAYRAGLNALPLYERMLLLDGNWKVSKSGGMRFKKHWFEIVEKAPEMDRVVRYWDRAGTEKTETSKNPDWTAGVAFGRTSRGGLYILDVSRFRETPGKVLAGIRNIAIQDGAPNLCELWLEEDPASAGKAERHYLSQELAEFGPRWNAPNSSKWIRSGPVSAAAENGLIKIVRGPWNKAFLDELDKFVDEDVIDVPAGYHDDQVDALSGAFNVLTRNGLGPRIHSMG